MLTGIFIVSSDATSKSLVSSATAISKLVEICGFSFVEHYGPLGAGFIEAHHTIPISDLQKGSKTSVDDLAMLCANCHRMIHRTDDPSDLQSFRDLVDRRRLAEN